MKLHVITRALDLRARRPEPFASAYAPIAAGPDVCAFARGDGELLVVVALRPATEGVALDVPPGRYRDVLSGREHDLAGAVAVGRLVGAQGIALLERV
jgi:maltooligosyltrehalose synthase